MGGGGSSFSFLQFNENQAKGKILMFMNRHQAIERDAQHTPFHHTKKRVFRELTPKLHFYEYLNNKIHLLSLVNE